MNMYICEVENPRREHKSLVRASLLQTPSTFAITCPAPAAPTPPAPYPATLFFYLVRQAPIHVGAL